MLTTLNSVLFYCTSISSYIGARMHSSLSKTMLYKLLFELHLIISNWNAKCENIFMLFNGDAYYFVSAIPLECIIILGVLNCSYFQGLSYLFLQRFLYFLCFFIVFFVFVFFLFSSHFIYTWIIVISRSFYGESNLLNLPCIHLNLVVIYFWMPTFRLETMRMEY